MGTNRCNSDIDILLIVCSEVYASLLHFFWMKCLARIECIYLNTTKKDAKDKKINVQG